VVSADLERAFDELESLYRALEAEIRERECRACGRCCRFDQAGHRLFATRLEALYLVARCGAPPRPSTAGRCGYQVEDHCTAREGRVLGCRVYFCARAGGAASQTGERYLKAAKRIAQRHGIPVDYRDIGAHLADLCEGKAAQTRCRE